MEADRHENLEVVTGRLLIFIGSKILHFIIIFIDLLWFLMLFSQYFAIIIIDLIVIMIGFQDNFISRYLFHSLLLMESYPRYRL